MGRPIEFRLIDFVGTFSAMTLVIVLVSVHVVVNFVLSDVPFVKCGLRHRCADGKIDVNPVGLME